LAAYLLLGVLLSGLALTALTTRRHVSSSGATIAGNVQVLRARLSGEVAEVAVEPNASIAAGTVLVRLRDTGIRARIDEQRLFLESHQEGLKSSVAFAKTQLQQTRSLGPVAYTNVQEPSGDESNTLQAASSDYQRSELGLRSTSPRQVSLEDGEAHLFDSKQGNVRANATLSGRSASGRPWSQRQIDALRGLAWDERGLLRAVQAYADLTQTLVQHELIAPVAGRIRLIARAPGDWVNVGDLLAVLDTAEQPWVLAWFDHDSAQFIQPGQGARVYARINDTHLEGRVESVGLLAAAGTVRTPAEAERLAAEVPVRIRLDSSNVSLIAGTRLEVAVDTERSVWTSLRERLKFPVR
jgi:membrane fusion protein (multidrug efflux system)